jgi:multimeric flavodoxin WrbA
MTISSMTATPETADQSLAYLRTKSRIVFLTTSNRWSGDKTGERPKSTELAYHWAQQLGESVTVIEVPKLIIYPCEGNVSTAAGNQCGVTGSLLKDAEKNPSGAHRCWASLNNPDDELWKISRALLASDCVVFFGSVRWGQMNSYYQKLIERLTWLENRHSALGEDNLLQQIDAGLVVIGHNWNDREVLETQMQVLKYFGFRVVPDLCWEWHYTTPDDESDNSYRTATTIFSRQFLQ